ncbi:FAD-dependent monooxygenase [Streptomyces sp. NRRL S-350]|uniref:FAD-dependent monooxygenase n=1 Tax=Streptomyces sp. NRRL S-350 TaxID=1463902 RepID=UPI00056B0B1C|nr:FAD-dependent monooxygenase [Streptomyces sp. NRRL S-350]
MDTTTVLIAGAGPVGLMLAGELAAAGVQAVVVDRRPQANEDWRISTFHQRSVELFEQRGLAEQLRGEGFYQWPTLHFGLLWLDLTKVTDQENYLVEMSRVETLLQQRAVDLGATVLTDREVVGLDADDEGVTVRLRSTDGESTIRCDYLVGADGSDSTVRRLAGFETVTGGPSWYGVLADLETYEGQIEAQLYPGGVFGAMPDPQRGLYRLQTIEFDVPAPPADTPVTIEELDANIERLTGSKRPIADARWLRRYSGRSEYVTQYRLGRVLLAGDAAHHHLFTAGHGLNTGLNDAVNLGWKLAAEVRGVAPEGLLDSYSAERQPVGARACEALRAQTALMYPLESVAPLRALLTDLITYDDVNRHLVTMVSDVRYPIPAPEGAEAAAIVGRPVPNVSLKTADGTVTGPAEALGAGRGVLLDLSGGAADLSALAPLADRLTVVAAEPDQAFDTELVLVRPDGFVAWAGAADAAGLDAAVATWFGTAAN